MSNNPQNLQSMLNKEISILGLILMIGHVSGNHYHMPQVQLFSGNSSTIEASLECSILGAAVSIQQNSAEWPTTEGGPLPDLQQYWV
jgi:hypothetical protein